MQSARWKIQELQSAWSNNPPTAKCLFRKPTKYSVNGCWCFFFFRESISQVVDFPDKHLTVGGLFFGGIEKKSFYDKKKLHEYSWNLTINLWINRHEWTLSFWRKTILIRIVLRQVNVVRKRKWSFGSIFSHYIDSSIDILATMACSMCTINMRGLWPPILPPPAVNNVVS